MILLLGAAGQLGQELTALAARRQVPLRGLRHAELDIADQPAVSAAIRAERPAVVVNAAAYTKVDQAEADAPAAYRANADGAGALAAACAAEGVPLVHISTDYMFDGSKPGAYVETDPIAPLGVYGASKAAGEAAVRRAAGRHLILRTSWVYGPYGNNFLKTMLRLAGERDELRIVADQRGCPTATADLAEAILHLLPGVAADGFPWGTYHCAGTGVTTWCDFAAEIVGAQGARHTAQPARHPDRHRGLSDAGAAAAAPQFRA